MSLGVLRENSLAFRFCPSTQFHPSEAQCFISLGAEYKSCWTLTLVLPFCQATIAIFIPPTLISS